MAAYVAVGVANTLIAYAIFLLLLNILNVHFLVSNVMAFITWTWFGFELQRRLVFQVGKSRSRYPKFLLTHVPFIILNSGLLWPQVVLLGIPPEVAYLLGIMVTTVLRFILSSRFVFRP
jgi:putative flippase GtrA